MESEVISIYSQFLSINARIMRFVFPVTLGHLLADDIRLLVYFCGKFILVSILLPL